MIAAILGVVSSLIAAPAVEPGLIELSRQVHESIDRQGRIVTSSSVESWGGGVLNRLATRDDWRVVILADPEPRAFSLPDGGIYLSAGLISLLEGQVELSFVLAHEAAHVLAGHSQLRAQAGTQDGGESLALERAADQQALILLDGVGESTSGASRVLARLLQWQQLNGEDADQSSDRVSRRLADRLAAVPESTELVQSAPVPGLESLRKMVFESHLARGHWQPVADCLAEVCSLILPAGERAYYRAIVDRLSGRLAAAWQGLAGLTATPEVIRERALVLEAQGDCQAALDQWRNDDAKSESELLDAWIARDCAVDHPAQKSSGKPPSSGRRFRLGNGSTLSLPEAWRGSRTGLGGRFSLDGFAIQQLEVDFPDEAPGPLLLALDGRLRAWRGRFLTRNARLAAARPFADGYSADLIDRDENGLSWSTRLYRFTAGGRVVEAEFRAPALHYFARDEDTVERILKSLK